MTSPTAEVVDLRQALHAERELLDRLARIAPTIAGELDPDRLMQRLTDEVTAVVGAQFGSFFYNVKRATGESYLLYTLSGAPREAFERFGMPRNTAVFAPTFNGECVVRSDDITKDPRYGKNAPHHGMPKGHLPVVSYLAVPVRSLKGHVIGGLFFGHREPAKFGEREERAALAVSALAGAALDNAELYRELRELNATLERRVSDRTSALLEANRELESFSYTVSHDLRAPIRHVGGFVDLLRDHAASALDEKALHYVETIKASATHMGALVDGLLAFSRLGRAELAKRPVDLARVAPLVLHELEPDIEGRTITWSIGDLPTVTADTTMIRLVLTNLVSNAIKYTRKEANARIEIGGERRGEDVLFWVKDNGVGFDMAYVDKLFGVFQRLHSSSEFEGTGIGLATARRIVHRHGGRIWATGATSGPERGAAVFVSIPAEPTA